MWQTTVTTLHLLAIAESIIFGGLVGGCAWKKLLGWLVDGKEACMPVLSY